jgi:hypothetical protein
MKTNTPFLVILIIASALNSAFASPKVDIPTAKPVIPITPIAEPLGNFTVFFWNAGEQKSIPPFLSISFLSISKQEIEKIMVWRMEIASRIQMDGGVLTENDYAKKIMPNIVNYSGKFMSTKAKAIFVEFTRIQRGFMLFPKK